MVITGMNRWGSSLTERDGHSRSLIISNLRQANANLGHNLLNSHGLHFAKAGSQIPGCFYTSANLQPSPPPQKQGDNSVIVIF